MNKVKYFVELRIYNRTIITRDNDYQRSEYSLKNRGGGILFEGLEEDFDRWIDDLYRDETNHKVIGIHNLEA